ncbi:hypothetical protein pdam_00023671 [Pocillopora damicornis]|uniref:C-type lectin domain-containing protein n=1 Tax=Pocillopora damicornis TaxID=46731 RepID=A0A3M6ULS4_POCDA|nr:hypothetical protein pdam_00023671 [Pocillopora damicornis]
MNSQMILADAKLTNFEKQARDGGRLKCPNITFKNSRYIFSVKGLSWLWNRETCRSQGKDLVSIETEEEWTFINDEIQRRKATCSSSRHMWSIGLTKNAGNWTWVSGRPLTICKWGKGEPSGENDAAFIYKRSSHGEQGVFGSGGRIWGQTYICEISTGKTQDLVAAISGGAEVIRGLQENVTLDGSPSYDPEAVHDDQSGMNFTWHYGKITRNYSFVLETKRDFFTEVNESALQYNGRASGVQISLDTGAMSLGDTCIVRLVVTKDYRNASVYQVIHFSKGDPPKIDQRCFINCLPKISPSVRLSVSSECQGLQCFQISSYEWILYQRYEGNASTAWQRKYDLELITSTPLNASNIVINGGSLAAGNKYRLALFITTTDGLRAMSAYDISTALPPTRGTCSITPSSGISLESYFTLSCVNWTSDSTPLSYRFQYRLKNGMYTVLYHGVNNSIVTLGIPPGNNAENYNIRLNVVVTDNFGISASPVNLTAQVRPSQSLRPDKIKSFLMPNDSLFQEVIRKGDLGKAAQLANSVLATLETRMNFEEKIKVIDFIIRNIASVKVNNTADLLQSSSVIGSALHVLEKVSPGLLELSLSAVDSQTNFLWSTVQLKDVADLSLVTRSAENLVWCLQRVLKISAEMASIDSTLDFQEQLRFFSLFLPVINSRLSQTLQVPQQGERSVNTALKVLGKVADALLALRISDENMISISTGHLKMTLGRHSPNKLAGLQIKGGSGSFILPPWPVTGRNTTSFVDTQMLSMSFNPYTWDSTKERVDSDVLFLDLKDNRSELLEVSSLPDDIVIVIPSKPRTMPNELWYFTTDDDLRFHEITVKYENTLIQVEVKPQEPTVHLFVYFRFGQRPTIRNYDLNATISQYGQCVWTASTHDKKERQPECSSNPLTPIATLARHPGKYFVGRYEGTTSTVWQRKYNLELITSTPLNASNIVINGGSLAAGNMYRLALFITTNDGLWAMSAYDISTALPPTRGTCSITPSSGISLESHFNLSCINWTSDSTPLSYRFQYRLENGMYTVLYHGVNNSIVTFGIPPGNNAENFTMRFNVVVTDNFGISASPVNLTVQVKPSQSLRQDEIRSLEAMIQEVIRKGDLGKAAQLANSVLQIVAQETKMNLEKKIKLLTLSLPTEEVFQSSTALSVVLI